MGIFDDIKWFDDYYPINRCSKYVEEERKSSSEKEPEDNDYVLGNYCYNYSFIYPGENACSEVGYEEWDYSSLDLKNICQTSYCCNSCSYNVTFGLCSAKTSVGVKCQRKKFNGNPLQCCLNDYGGCGNQTSSNVNDIDLCFSANAKGNKIDHENSSDACNSENCKSTCHPCQRNINTMPDYHIKNLTE